MGLSKGKNLMLALGLGLSIRVRARPRPRVIDSVRGSVRGKGLGHL